jgi:hypothetical protein
LPKLSGMMRRIIVIIAFLTAIPCMQCTGRALVEIQSFRFSSNRSTHFGRHAIVAFSPRDGFIVSRDPADRLKLWKLAGPRYRYFQDLGQGYVEMAMSDDESMMAATKGQERIEIWRRSKRKFSESQVLDEAGSFPIAGEISDLHFFGNKYLLFVVSEYGSGVDSYHGGPLRSYLAVFSAFGGNLTDLQEIAGEGGHRLSLDCICESTYVVVRSEMPSRDYVGGDAVTLMVLIPEGAAFKIAASLHLLKDDRPMVVCGKDGLFLITLDSTSAGDVHVVRISKLQSGGFTAPSSFHLQVTGSLSYDKSRGGGILTMTTTDSGKNLQTTLWKFNHGEPKPFQLMSGVLTDAFSPADRHAPLCGLNGACSLWRLGPRRFGKVKSWDLDGSCERSFFFSNTSRFLLVDEYEPHIVEKSGQVWRIFSLEWKPIIRRKR